MTTREYQEKQGRNWVTTYKMSGEDALHSLAADLAAKYVGKAAVVRKVERRNNYDGTQTYTVYYNFLPGDNRRAVYTTDIY